MLKTTLSRYDFESGELGRQVTFKIYSEDLSAYDLTTYTAVVMQVLNYAKNPILEIAATKDAGTGGSGSFTFTANNTIGLNGLLFIRFKLEKTGEVSFTSPVRIFVE